MKKLIAIPLILLSILTLSACSSKEYDIVTSLFPQYDITRTIVGDKDLTYTLLLNPGVEAHDFEPTSKQVVMINNAKLFIYTSDEMEPWAKNLENNKTTFLNLQLASNEDHDHAHAESISYSTTDEHDHVHDNLHYWVHLHNTLHMIEVILEEIIHLDEKNADYYTNNANNLKEQVRAISAKFDQISALETKQLHFVGHNVFSLLNEEKSLNIQSLTDSFSPDADPTSTQIQAMLNQIIETNASYVFYDPLETVILANTIKNDLKSKGYEITLLPLYSMHNVSKSQFESNTTLLDLWNENVQNIATAYDLELI